MSTRLILASASPQRRKLLEGLGVSFEVIPSEVDEAACKEMDPLERARVLSQLKAQRVAQDNEGAWVIGCDTIVVSSAGRLLEKPTSSEEAQEMLQHQSGTSSEVHSGLMLLSPQGGCRGGVSSSRVRFKRLSQADLDWWVSTGLWEGRSGAFQIEGQGQLLIEELIGDWSGVVGLPISLLGDLAQRAGLQFPSP